MKEFLPLLIGCVVGLGFLRVPRRAWPVVVPIGCILGGATASAINGELNGPMWGLFVSFDAALVWLGAAVAILLHRLMSAEAQPRRFR